MLNSIEHDISAAHENSLILKMKMFLTVKLSDIFISLINVKKTPNDSILIFVSRFISFLFELMI